MGSSDTTNWRQLLLEVIQIACRTFHHGEAGQPMCSARAVDTRAAWCVTSSVAIAFCFFKRKCEFKRKYEHEAAFP
jgi:hypothetical protein